MEFKYSFFTLKRAWLTMFSRKKFKRMFYLKRGYSGRFKYKQKNIKLVAIFALVYMYDVIHFNEQQYYLMIYYKKK